VEESRDRDFQTALLAALVREAGAFAGRGMAILSQRARQSSSNLTQFVLVDCKPLAARLYIVDSGGAPWEYYRETGDMIPSRFAHLVNEFIGAGMDHLSVDERRDVSRRLELESIRLGVVIEAGSPMVRGLVLGPGGRLAGSDELFSLSLDAPGET
jgi:hypothetical protein